MKKHWLRGILLGASLALLLAGGVALAQTLTVVADEDCVECWPGPYGGPPPDEYVVDITLDEWDPTATMCHNVYLNGSPMYAGGLPYCGTPPSEPPPVTVPFWAVACERLPMGYDLALDAIAGSSAQVEANAIEDLYGEWKLRVWQPGTDNADSASWRFADVCEEEFIPEAGTFALLGSGLAGLAGYGALRLRSGRAVR